MNSGERFAQFAKVTVVVAATLVLFVTASSLGFVGSGVRSVVGHVFPEGWSLFAVPQGAVHFRAAEKRDGAWTDATRLPLAEASNTFGLNRSVRWQNVEIIRLIGAVGNLDSWTQCDARPLRCLARAERARVLRVVNETPYPSLCGRAGLIRQQIVPIDELDGGEPFETTHVVALNVRC